MNRPWQDRLFARGLPDDNGCWIWQGRGTTQRGYGVFGGPKGYGPRTTTAHRWAWVAANGAIPDGLEIDHLCNVPACINPDHLEAVTRAENMRRRSERQTHCKRGHEFTEATTMRGTSGRACRTCFNMLRRGYRARDKALRIELATVSEQVAA